MPASPYKKVDVVHLPKTANPDADASEVLPDVPSDRVRWWIIPFSVFLCCVQVFLTVVGSNVLNTSLNSTIIPVFAFAVLFVLVLVFNPLLGLLRFGARFSPRLNRIELICVFTALFATAPLASFGLAGHLVPLIPSPHNPAWNTPQSGWSETLTAEESPVLNPHLYLGDPDAVRLFFEGTLLTAPPEGAPLVRYLEYYTNVFLEIPWWGWLKPVALWLVFLLGCVAIFYSLSYVFIRLWADREKLIFPLAQLPESLLPSDQSKRAFPALFYLPAFWVGFAIAAAVLSWNASTAAGWILDGFQIPLGMNRNDTGRLLVDSWLDPLLGNFSSPRFLIIFTAIGIAFLLPTAVSFSTWFYYLVVLAMVMLAVGLGFGQRFSDFPSDFTSTANFITAQGGGALLAFAALSLYRTLQEYFILAARTSGSERWKLLCPVLWLAGSILVVLAWLMWNQIPLLLAMGFILFLTLFTIGMMRLVSEAGIYFFQANFGFFHAIQSFGLGKVIPGSFLAPLLPFYSIFFMDIKTFVAPNLITCAKIQRDQGTGRRFYHLNMIVCFLISIFFAIGFLIFLAHVRGAQQMSAWFFNGMPLNVLQNTQIFAAGLVSDFSANGIWFLIGAGWLLFTVWMRKSFFWFPHPVGYILLFNPLTASLWLSFFIGWFCKSITVKYGGKTTFDLLKPFFLGLIFGELFIIVFWMLLGMSLGFSSGVDLNRT